MYKYKYCTNCGALLIKKRENFYDCLKCNFKLYINVATSAAGLIFNENGNLLMTKRAYDPGKGMWSLPAGFLELGETAEQGLRREIEEEIGLKINEFEYFGSFSGIYKF